MIYPQIMIDIETLGKSSQAPVTQIGAVAFDIATGAMGPSISIDVRPDFTQTPPDLSTVIWWMEQSDGARAHFKTLELAQGPAHGLRTLDAFINANAMAREVEVWAMPPEFDLVILGNLRRIHGIPAPWRYDKTRDLRTLESLAGKSKKDRVVATVAHSAEADAIAQAQTAVEYHSAIWDR